MTDETGPSTGGPERPTYVVDAAGTGQYRAIAPAIAAANPGDRILIRPQRYEERLLIEKADLEIVGDGQLGEVVLEAAGNNVVAFRASSGTISNLTIRQTAGAGRAVDIADGRLILDHCDVTSQAGAGVAVYGSAAPTIRHNRIHDSKDTGVIVWQHAEATLQENEISGNAGHGIHIAGDAKVVANEVNRVFDNQMSGVLVAESGQGELENNDIFANERGVWITSPAETTLTNNHIYKNRRSGVYIQNGQPALDGNDILENGLETQASGVVVEKPAAPVLHSNRIHLNIGNGVLFDQEAGGTVGGVVEGKDVGNDIFENKVHGVVIQAGSNATVVRNRIHDNGQKTVQESVGVGVLVTTKGQGRLEDNQIFANTMAGVEISQGGDPQVRRNQITKNGTVGVYAHDQAGGIVEDNDLRDNTSKAYVVDSKDTTVGHNDL